MKRRWRMWLMLGFGALLAASFLLPAAHWRVIGWAKGEAFYQGMPVSWWAQEIEENYEPVFSLSGLDDLFSVSNWVVKTSPSFWEKVRQRLVPGAVSIFAPYSYEEIPLLNSDPAAFAVLLGLIRDDSAKVRRVAISGLLVQKQEKLHVLATLAEAMKDPDELVRKEASMAFITLQ